MTTPTVAGKAPIPVDVTAGQTYWWCSCGKSANQPFCDGSHQGTSFLPMEWTADSDRKAFFCTCKLTKNGPLCDGSHKSVA